MSTSNYLYVHEKEEGREQLVENSTLFRVIRGLKGELSLISSFLKNDYQNCSSLFLGR